MPTTDPRVDAYIARAQPFARPILEGIRNAFHKGCPDIVETIKWGAPSFEKHGMVGGMAAFKAHATFGFWRGAELPDPDGILRAKDTASFMAEKFTDVAQLPSQAVLAKYVRAAAALNAAGARPAKPRRTPRPAPKTPSDLAAALKRDAKARAAFAAFPPSHQREYVEWITEAKKPETRAKRVAQAVAWMAEGKSRNWKYE